MKPIKDITKLHITIERNGALLADMKTGYSIGTETIKAVVNGFYLKEDAQAALAMLPKMEELVMAPIDTIWGIAVGTNDVIQIQKFST